MKATVLFVDDQPNILQGLRRNLRTLRNEWDMLFATGGEDALEKLGKVPVDVIVTDMRMPGMDGAELLTEVIKRRPDTIRIVLSGQTDMEGAFRLIGTSHQFLSKPCETGQLVDTIKRVLSLRDQLADERLRKQVGKMKELPTPSVVHNELVRRLSAPTPSQKEVAGIIAHDPSLTARFLHVVSSGYFGSSLKNASVRHAVRRLGIERVTSLLLTPGIITAHEKDEIGFISLGALRHHSVTCANVARAIAKNEGLGKNVEAAAFVAGLLHDIGALVLAAHQPDLDENADFDPTSGYGNRLGKEIQELGASHATLGAYLLGLWGLADPIVQAIAYHHTPMDCPDRSLNVLTMVHVAESLTQPLLNNGYGVSYDHMLDMDYLAEVGVTDRLSDWKKIIADLNSKKDGS